ncbi:MAG TPA: hypothetical protein VEC12_04470 [Bacteroidia bacterium]|nr:hypothetical protein [Bacteroidia bacterium]
MKQLIFAFFISLNVFAYSQIEPSPEEIMKYEWLMPHITERNLTSPETLRMLDSLYALDSSSLFLTGILGEATMRQSMTALCLNGYQLQ